MRVVNLPNRKTGKIDAMPAYTGEDFPYDDLSIRARSYSKGHKKVTYLDTWSTFDIETTTLTKEIAWMYHWQMCVGGILAYGRTWKEWESFLNRLIETMEVSQERKFVIYIHNMGFEFQFMKDFLKRSFGEFRIFAPQKRKPIRIECDNGLEFRCSWKLSNMSLEMFTDTEKDVEHVKMAGDLDYRKTRTPKTELTDIEFAYCMADVLGLYEAVKCKMEEDQDSLNSIPMTSTGYPRRDCRKASQGQKGYRDMFKRNALNKNTYTLLKEAARGGDTHANRRLSGRIIEDVMCYDVQSSYPYVMMTKEYPMTAFTPYGDIEKRKELEDLLESKACLFRITMVGVRIKDEVSMPYISDSKCREIVSPLLENGRILKADGLSMTVTDIDYRIIKEQYDIEEEYIADMHIAEYGPLPESLRNVIKYYFEQKCILKHDMKEAEKIGDQEQYEKLQYLYGKIKNKLNGIFGMCYTDPVHNEVIMEEDGSWKERQPDIEEALQKFNKSRNSFLIYSWGVWTTAHARAHLNRLRLAAGQEKVVYQDTDSVKGGDLNDYRIQEENGKIMQEDKEHGAYLDYAGKTYYLGVYEREPDCKRFKTLGAKKYAYEDMSGKLHVTVSGVGKKKAPGELGRIENFKIGFIFKEAGGLELHYNESPIHQITMNGDTFETASSIAMLDSTYTLGITKGYEEVIGMSLDEI